MSRVVRKPAFRICENKDADQLRGEREADQRLCFRYTDTTIPLLSKSEISSLKLHSLGCVAKTKALISFAFTARLISAFVFATRILQSLYFLNPKFQASSCTAWVVSYLVEYPEDRFSQNEAHMIP